MKGLIYKNYKCANKGIKKVNFVSCNNGNPTPHKLVDEDNCSYTYECLNCGKLKIINKKKVVKK